MSLGLEIPKPASALLHQFNRHKIKLITSIQAFPLFVYDYIDRPKTRISSFRVLAIGWGFAPDHFAIVGPYCPEPEITRKIDNPVINIQTLSLGAGDRIMPDCRAGVFIQTPDALVQITGCKQDIIVYYRCDRT